MKKVGYSLQSGRLLAYSAVYSRVVLGLSAGRFQSVADPYVSECSAVQVLRLLKARLSQGDQRDGVAEL